MRNSFPALGFILFYLVFNFCNASQRSDYIMVQWVTSKGDTLQGYIQKNIIDGNIITVKNNLSSKDQFELSADNVKFILIYKEILYESTNINYGGSNQNIFVELKMPGDASLYQGFYKDSGKLFFLKINDEIYLIRNRNIKGFLKNLLGDCFEESSMNNDFYTEPVLKKALSSYNHCKNPDVYAYDPKAFKIKKQFYIGPKINYNTGKFKFSRTAYYKKGDYSNISSLGFGLTGGVNLNKNLNFQTELSYLKKESNSISVQTSVNPDYTSDVSIKFSYIDWPLYLVYFLNHKKVSPYIGGGLNTGILLSGKIEDSPYRLDPDLNGPPDVKFNNLDFGLLGMAGIFIKTDSKSMINLSAKFTTTDTDYIVFRRSQIAGGYGAGAFSLNTKRFEISISYLFNL